MGPTTGPNDDSRPGSRGERVAARAPSVQALAVKGRAIGAGGSSRWLGLALLAVIAGCRSEPPPNLVLISLDTVRRDHLQSYGYARDTAPAVARLAAESAVFENAFAQDVETNPSHASMLTGLYPNVHGNRHHGLKLRAGVPTLAAILEEAGFRTGAFVSAVTLRAPLSGLDRGFESYDDRFAGMRRDGRLTTASALRWLRSLPRDAEFFLFLHLYDAHGPYASTGRYATLFDSETAGPRLERIPDYQPLPEARAGSAHYLNDYVDRYDEMIRYADDRVAMLLQELNLDRTVVVVLADHGETLGGRWWPLDHGARVVDEQARIPLIVHVPGLEPRRIEASVETVDLLPTLLELLGVELPPGVSVQGRSLVPLLEGQSVESREFTFTGARPVDRRYADRAYQLDPGARIESVRSGRWKLVELPGLRSPYLELYDLASDPGETTNVAELHPAVRNALRKVLSDWRAAGRTDERPRELDPEAAAQLRALGYLD